MKVLIATGVFPPESGGPATYSKVLLEKLPERGIDISVLPFREVRKYPKVIRHLVYTFLIFKEARHVDLVLALDPFSVGFPAALVSFVFRKKFVVKVVGDYAWEQSVGRFEYEDTIENFQTAEGLPLIPQVMRFVERQVVKRADRVIVPSKYLGRIVQKWGIEKKKISVVYNSVEPVAVGLKQVIRGLLRFKGELIMSSGRLVSWKGFEGLIRVVKKLAKKRPHLKLLIVGGGPNEGKLEEYVKKHGLADSVIFTRRVENAVALRYMRASDVFVLNTRYEGFSHTLLEAAMIGVPIVTTKIGGNPEFIDDNINGFLVKPDDEALLEKRITALLDSPDLRAKISGAAKRKVEKFSVKKMVDETEKVLRKV